MATSVQSPISKHPFCRAIAIDIDIHRTIVVAIIVVHIAHWPLPFLSSPLAIVICGTVALAIFVDIIAHRAVAVAVFILVHRAVAVNVAIHCTVAVVVFIIIIVIIVYCAITVIVVIVIIVIHRSVAVTIGVDVDVNVC